MGTEIYRLNANSGIYEFADYIKSDEEIDNETGAKIRAKYNDNEREKRIRLGILNPQDAQFIEFDNFAEECRAEGRALKQLAADARALLIEVELPLEEGQTEVRKIYTRE